MNNLISPAANHWGNFTAPLSAPTPHPLPAGTTFIFTSAVERSLHPERSVFAEIVEEILASAGPSIIMAAPAMKYRPGRATMSPIVYVGPSARVFIT